MGEIIIYFHSRFRNVLEIYFSKRIYELALENGPQSCAYLIPMDTAIKEMFLKQLFGIVLRKPQDTQMIISFCKLIINESPTEDFELRDFQVFCEAMAMGMLSVLLVKETSEFTLKLNSFLNFLDKLAKEKLITHSTIINIWQGMSKLIKKRPIIVRMLLKFIKDKKKFVNKLINEEESSKVMKVRDILKHHQSNPELKDCERDFEDVFKFFEELIQNPEGSSLKDVKQEKEAEKTAEESQASTSENCNKCSNQETAKTEQEVDSKLKIFTSNELKIVHEKIAKLTQSESNQTIIFKLKQENLKAGICDLLKVIFLFADIIVYCLERRHVKRYVTYVLDHIKFKNALMFNSFMTSLVHDKLREFYAADICKNLIDVVVVFYKQNICSQTDVIGALKILSKNVPFRKTNDNILYFCEVFENFFKLKSISKLERIEILSLVQEIKLFIENVRNMERKRKLERIVEILGTSTKNISIESKKQEPKMKEKCETVRIPKETSKDMAIGKDGVNIFFEKFVDKLSNNKALKGPLILINQEEEAKYFLKKAVKSKETTMKFADCIRNIYDKPNFSWFSNRVLTLCYEKFYEQHDPITQKKFSKEEMDATEYFISILFQFKVISPQRLENLSTFIWSRSIYTEYSAKMALYLMTALKDFLITHPNSERT